MEIWKAIEEYEDLYQVSNLGRVKSLGNNKSRKERILKPQKDGKGYLRVNLCKEGKVKKLQIHRLVAQSFLENPNNLPQINHKDENKANNCVENLEWCSASYNCNFGTRNERVAKAKINGKTSKLVLQYSLDGTFIREWASTRECGRNGFDKGNVVRCCNGKLKSHKGFVWRYV